MKFVNIYLSKTNNNEICKKNFFNIKNEDIIINLNKEKNFLEKIQCSAQKIQFYGIKKINLTGKIWDLEKVWSFWQGYYNPKNKDFEIKWFNLNDKEEQELQYRIKVIDWVRNVINLPANQLNPENFINQTIKIISDATKDITFNIIKGEELLKNKYMGIYQVGSGSKEIPCFLSLDYNPNKSKESPVFACLVGKGITFDTGGYSLKNSSSMNTMKSDMAGAATLVGSLVLGIYKGLKKRVKLYLCCAENMISSKSLRIGDIICYRNGKTVEVMNTDAEGRLVLADGLIDASRQNAQLIIDAATLTGAAKIAVGNDYHSIFTFDKSWLQKIMLSAKLENELFWQLPLLEIHRKQIYSDFADLSNISSIKYTASASNAAAFLSYFVENYKKNWIHIDCSASYQENKTSKWSVGATGIGVRTITNLLLNN